MPRRQTPQVQERHAKAPRPVQASRLGEQDDVPCLEPGAGPHQNAFRSIKGQAQHRSSKFIDNSSCISLMGIALT